MTLEHRRLGKAWLQVRLQVQSPMIAEDQELVDQRLERSNYLVVQLLLTIWSRLQRNRLSEGFSSIEDRSTRLMGLQSVFEVLEGLSTSRQSSSFEVLKGHSRSKMVGLNQHQAVLSLVAICRSHQRSSKQTAFISLLSENQGASFCADCRDTRDRTLSEAIKESLSKSLRRKGSSLRSSSLARERTQRVFAGLTKLHRLSICWTLDPFK